MREQVPAHAAEAPKRAQKPSFSSTMLLQAHLLQLAHPKTNLHPATHHWPLHHSLVLSVSFQGMSREPLAFCARHAQGILSSLTCLGATAVIHTMLLSAPFCR